MAVRVTTTGNVRRRTQKSSLPGLAIVACAIVVAAFLLSRRPSDHVGEQKAPTVVAEFDTIMVPVPVEPVAVGARVRDIRVRNVSFPKHQIPEGALTSLGGFTEAIVIAPLPANLPLFRKNLSLTAQATNPVTERIPPGMRAMTIRVDATTAVEGWAGSGTIVDVLLVEKDRTTVVAEKVKILSAERQVAPVEGAAAPNVPSTVTLLVTQDQCLAINTAIPLGRIAFALRSTRDEEGWDDTVYTSERLKGATGGAGNSRSAVNGYVTMREGDEKRSFALTDGQWVKTETVPEGFFVAQSDQD